MSDANIVYGNVYKIQIHHQIIAYCCTYIQHYNASINVMSSKCGMAVWRSQSTAVQTGANTKGAADYRHIGPNLRQGNHPIRRNRLAIYLTSSCSHTAWPLDWPHGADPDPPTSCPLKPSCYCDKVLEFRGTTSHFDFSYACRIKSAAVSN